MTPVVLSLLLHAAPTLELSASSDCSAELRESFRESEFPLASEGEVELTLKHGTGNELTASRDDAVALRRELGPGTCGEASRAAVVIVGRWLTSLPASTWKGPGKKKTPASIRDAGSTGVTANGASDDGSLTVRDAGAARSGARDGGGAAVVTSVRDARDAGAPAVTSARDAGVAPAVTTRDAGVAPSVTNARDAAVAFAAANAGDAGVTNARDAGVAPASDTRDGGVRARPDAGGNELAAKPLTGEGLSGVRIESTGGGITSDGGTALGGRLTIDAGAPERPPEAVIGRIGVAPPGVTPVEPPQPPPSRPLRIEVTHAEALVGGGVAIPGTPDAINGAVSVDFALVVNHRLRLSLLGAFDFGGRTNVLDERSQVRGQLATRGILAAPTAMLCLDTSVRLCGGVLAGARIAQGDTSGPFIFQRQLAWRGAFVVGPALQAVLIIGRFHLALDATLLVTPVPPSFSVEGLPTTLSWPVAQGLFRLSIGVGSL